MRIRRLGALAGTIIIATILISGGVILSMAQGNPTLQPTFGPVIGQTSSPEAAITIVVTATLESAVSTATPTPEPTITPTPEPPTATPIPPLPPVRSDLMGIQVYPIIEQQNWPILLDGAYFMGFKWLKAQINWKEVQPQPGVLNDTFNAIRDNMIAAGRRGFKVMISIVNAPDWARPAAARGQLDGPPENPQALADFVTAVINSWGTQYLNAIEIWNEPNLIREWTGIPKGGAVYKRYFDAAYNAIRALSSDIIVITAGPAPAGDTPDGSVNDRTWLRELYRAGLPINDGNFAIGIHPYGWANAPEARCCASPSQGWDDQKFFFFLDNVADYRQIMVENGHSAGKLWATEFGWASFDGLKYRDHREGPPAIPPTDPGLGWMLRLNAQQQAEYIVRAFNIAQNGDLASFMGPMVLWNMNFAALEGYVSADQPARSESGFSVLNTDWAPRPAYEYLQAAPKQ